MTAVELCDPLFRYICRLNRSARKGRSHDLGPVRSEVEGLLAELRAEAGRDVGLKSQFERLEWPLILFVDFMVRSSRLPFAHEWKPLAEARDEPAGDEVFFRLLDETLAEKSPEATERLEVFYVCLGLGYAGRYADQPEYLRQKMLACSARRRDRTEFDERARLCPSAYEHTDTRMLIPSIGLRLGAIAIVLIGLILALFIANVYLFRRTETELRTLLERILEQDRAVAEHVVPSATRSEGE